MTGPIDRFQSRIRGLVVLFLAGVVGFSTWNVLAEREDALMRAELQAAGYVRALAEHSESAFAESDRVLRDLLHDFRSAGGVGRFDRRALHEELRRQAEGAPQIGSLFLADRNGEMFANSLEFPQKPIHVGDRDYFRYYLDVPGADLTLGKPVISRLVGRWRFNLMRPLNPPAEPFDGLVAVAFEVDYFKRFFDEVTLGRRGRIALIREDGAPLVYEPYVDNAYRFDFRESHLFRNELPKSPSGTYRNDSSAVDGSPRIAAWRRLSRFPVIAMVSFHRDDVLEPWRRRAVLHGVVTVALCLVVLALTRLMFRHLERLREAQVTLAEQREEQGRLEEQLRHIQKIEAVGQLAGGVAHDFNNLLTPIIVSAELAKRRLPSGDPLHGRLDGILSAAHKAKELTQKLLSVARRQMLAMEPVDLNRVVSDFREILRRTIRENISIDVRTSPGSLTIRGDQGQLEQILLNLAVNAQDAIEGSGRIAIETGRVTIDAPLANANPGMRQGPHAYLSFADSGCGMGEKVLAHAFEPFYTTKPVGQGTGLGLATVYGIVKQHDGYIRIESAPGAGTTLTLYFPSSGEDEAPRPAPEEKEPTPVEPGNCRVLVVEDNEMVRSLIVGMLGTFGYRVRETDSPAEALRIAADPGTVIDLLVSDMVMPEMNGQELYDRIREVRPLLPVLFISGYTSDASVPAPCAEDSVRFLKKPFTVGEFLSNVRALLGSA